MGNLDMVSFRNAEKGRYGYEGIENGGKMFYSSYNDSDDDNRKEASSILDALQNERKREIIAEIIKVARPNDYSEKLVDKCYEDFKDKSVSALEEALEMAKAEKGRGR